MPLGYNQVVGAITDTPCGSWQSLEDQFATVADDEYIATFNGTDFERDMVLTAGTKVYVSNSGLYNVQYALQFHNSGGGGSSAHAHVWLKKNGTTIAETGTRQSVTTNSPFGVCSRDFFITLAVNDYIEVAWSVNHTNINLYHEDADAPVPVVPSVVLTVHQVG
jgi:hypothetical protein